MKSIKIIFVIFVFANSCKSQNNKQSYLIDNNGDSVLQTSFPNQKIKEFVQVKNGKFNGTYIENYENGKIKLKGQYEMGSKVGLWINYNIEGLATNVNFFYNDTIIYKDIDAKDYHWIEFNEELNRIKISVPKYWEVIQPTKPILFAIKKKKESSSKFSPNLILLKDVLNGSDFDNYVSNNLEKISKSFSFFKIVSGGELSIGTYNARQYVYIAISDDTKIGGLVTFVQGKDNTVYIVTGMALNEPSGAFLKYRGLFEAITETINFY